MHGVSELMYCTCIVLCDIVFYCIIQIKLPDYTIGCFVATSTDI